MNVAPLSLLLLCLLLLPAYYATSSFTSKNGVLLFVLGASAFLLRILLLGKYPLLATLNKDSILLSVILLLVPSTLFIVYSFIKKGSVLREKRNYLFRLLFGYLLFGALQQMFFLSVFTDTVYYLTLNYKITFLVSVVFYLVFHFEFIREMKKFLLILICFGILNTLIYLWLGNTLPQMLMHGVAGSILYTAFSTVDQLKKRLS
jgi:hypothetical protein